ncbi:MAG: peptidoglycan D,D-transpeptidase FtsI family protein [Nocardioidaceae bacterium]
MNKPIRTMAIFCMLLFVALLLNATYLQYVEAGSLNAHNDNKRVRDAEFSHKRGAILVAGKPIAKSVKSNDSYKYLRTYPKPREYAQSTGYYSYLWGRHDIESSQNDILSGNDPRLFVNRVVDLFGDAQPQGGSVSLTLNPKAQDAAYGGLAALSRAQGRSVQGAVVALQPSTGKILALASYPSYDPNRLASHNFNATVKAKHQLDSNPLAPEMDRALGLRLPPGSTFKLVTAAAALSSGQYTPNSSVPGGSSLQLPQATKPLTNENGISCGGGQITLTRALEVSCNVSFGWLGLRLGDDAIRAQAEKFGFGSTALQDLPGQVPSVFPSNPDPPLTAYSAIGQYNVAATPLQMAMVAAGIANGGTVMRPYLVDEMRAPDLSVLSKTDPEPYRSNAISASVARELTQMMVEVVQVGTGTPAQIPGITVAGKTGTAQSAPSRPPYAWFVSFAPADNPKVAVAVLVQDAGVARNAISGGGLAAPIAKRVMEAVIHP